MKKTILIFVLSAMVLITTALWFLNVDGEGSVFEYLLFSPILIIIGFGIYLGVSRGKSVLRKEPVEDEMSRKVLSKASSLSFYISLYFWLFMMYISDKLALENHTLIGLGILAMAIIFFLSWVGIKIFGLKNE